MPPATGHKPLPPSVEKAYYRKCIELRRRINEVEENNDAARLRKSRLDRTILKLRLERAFLLEQLASRMELNVDESDRSTSPPPTPQPQDKPLRSKRSHRQKTPTLNSQPSAHSNHGPSNHLTHPTQSPPNPSTAASSVTHNHPAQPPLAPLQPFSSAHSTPDPQRMGGSDLFFSRPGVSPIAGANGTPGPAPANLPPLSHGLPPPPGQFLPSAQSTAMDRTPSASENGNSASAAAIALSEMREGTGAANGERRGPPADTDAAMTDAPPAASEGGAGFGSGFTAVNR